MTCAEAIARVFAKERGALSIREVIERVYALYPEKPWKEMTIRLHLRGLSVNHPSGHNHPSLQSRAFLYYLGDRRYRRWIPDRDGAAANASTTADDLEAEDDQQSAGLIAAIDTTVSLERDLERALLRDLGQLENGLQLYRGTSLSGQQFNTQTVGRIDILAVDAQGNLVVIELKAGKADDQVCGQVLRYMGWVTERLARGRQVRGIIVAHEFSDALKYAAKAMPTVQLKRYAMRFEFSDV